MFNLAVTFIAAALLAPSAAVGQTLTPCVSNCSTLALPAGGCTALTDLNCVCSSTDFQTAAAACITQDCPDELEAAITAQTQACAAVGNDTSTSDDGTGSSTSSGSAVVTPVVTPGGTTSRASITPAGTTRPPTSSSSSRSTSSTATNSTGAGFHTASIASGVTLALFGAAFSLF